MRLNARRRSNGISRPIGRFVLALIRLYAFCFWPRRSENEESGEMERAAATFPSLFSLLTYTGLCAHFEEFLGGRKRAKQEKSQASEEYKSEGNMKGKQRI